MSRENIVTLGNGMTSLQALANGPGDYCVYFCHDTFHEPGSATKHVAEEVHRKLMESNYFTLRFLNVGAIDALIAALETAKAAAENAAP